MSPERKVISDRLAVLWKRHTESRLRTEEIKELFALASRAVRDGEDSEADALATVKASFDEAIDGNWMDAAMVVRAGVAMRKKFGSERFDRLSLVARVNESMAREKAEKAEAAQ